MAHVLSSCIRGYNGSFSTEDVELIDHRSLVILENEPPRFTCPIVLEATMRFVRKVEPTMLTLKEYRKIADRFPLNRTVQDFLLEGDIVSSIRAKGATIIRPDIQGAQKMVVFEGSALDVDFRRVQLSTYQSGQITQPSTP